MKKILKLSIITGMFNFFIFGAGFCFAVSAPTGLTPCNGGEQSIIVTLDWYDIMVDHYELYYKMTNETSWTDRYPSALHSEYQVSGLEPSRTYEWYVVSCGDADCAISAPSRLCSFTTEELSPSNGGWTPINGQGISLGLMNPLRADNLEQAINALINFLFVLAMGLAPVLIIYAAFLLLTSAGDPAKVSKARTIITWTLIAVAIILLAKGIPSIIKGALGG